MMAAFNKLILGVGVSSFVIFQLLFHVLSSWVSARVTSGFNNLDQKKKIEWNSRTVSTFHALVVGAFCLYILLYDEAVNADHVWGDPSLVKLNLAITTGYLISGLHEWRRELIYARMLLSKPGVLLYNDDLSSGGSPEAEFLDPSHKYAVSFISASSAAAAHPSFTALIFSSFIGAHSF